MRRLVRRGPCRTPDEGGSTHNQPADSAKESACSALKAARLPETMTHQFSSRAQD
jgi:hypothetical protein